MAEPRRSWWRAALPPSPLGRRLTVLSAVYSTGYGIFMVGGVVFLTRWVGLSAREAATVFSVAAVAALVLTVPIGALVDRVGPRRVWLAVTLAQATGYALYPLAGGLVTALGVASAIAVAESALAGARQAYTAAAFEPAQRIRVVAYTRSASNLGLTAGALLAGLVLAADRRWLYPALVYGLVTVLAAVWWLVRDLPPVDPPVPEPGRRRFLAVRDGPYLAVVGLSGVLCSHATVLSVVLPLWIVFRSDAPRAAVAWCFALNTVLTILFQVRATRGTETVRGAALAHRRTGLVLAAMCLVLAGTVASTGAATLVLLGLGTLLLTIGELWHSAGAWSISVGLAPADRRGEYLSAFRLGSQLQTVAGPLGLTALTVGAGAVGWVVLATLLAVAGVLFVPLAGWAERRAYRGRPAAAPAAA